MKMITNPNCSWVKEVLNNLSMAQRTAYLRAAERYSRIVFGNVEWLWDYQPNFEDKTQVHHFPFVFGPDEMDYMMEVDEKIEDIDELASLEVMHQFGCSSDIFVYYPSA